MEADTKLMVESEFWVESCFAYGWKNKISLEADDQTSCPVSES